MELDIYLSLSSSSAFIYELFCGEAFATHLVLSAILFPIKSPGTSAVFWIALFEAVLSASVADYLAWWKLNVNVNVLLLKFLLIFLRIFVAIVSAKDKNP